MNDLLNTLAQHHDLILLAEMGAMLHDIGKLSPGFIFGVLAGKDRPKHSPKNLHPDCVLQADASVIPPEVNQPLTQILSKPIDATIANLLGTISLASFIARHDESLDQLPDLLKLVVIADKRDSGEDQYTAMDVFQRTAVYGTTVFGYEADPIDPSNFDQARQEIWRALAKTLQSNGNWGDRRDEFVKVLADKLSLTRGKTQRAANDITLYQHSRAVGTRFKAYLARDLVDTTRQGQEEFRLLNVAWDAWRFSVHVPRLSDAAGRRELIEEFKEAVRRLVELDCPLGNVVYGDDSTLVALVADLDIQEELQAKIERLAREITDGEIAPTIQLSPPTTQVTDIIARRQETRQSNPPGEMPPWVTDWADRRSSVICPICGHRPLQSNDDPHCTWCGEVRGRGVRRRLEEKHGTVWTGEIADRNGRLALLVGKFGLDRWLNGELLHTALITSSRGRAQARGLGDYPTCSLVEALEACVQNPDTLSDLISLDDARAKYLRNQLVWARKDLEKVRLNSQIPLNIRPQRIRAMEERLSQTKAQVEPELATLQGAWLVKDVFTQYQGKTDQNLRNAAARLPSSWRLVERYATILARKNPSAARLFRVWETTEEFFVRAIPDAVKILFDEDRVRPGCEQRYRQLWGQAQRLRFALSDVPCNLRDGIYTAVVVNRDGQQREMEVFVSLENDRPMMITINRLSTEEMSWLKLCVDAGYVELLARETGRKEHRGDLLGIQEVTSEEYLPYHILTTSPEMIIAVLPAEIALQVAQHVWSIYLREMGKVMGRLPLYIGLFFMDDHFPMFVALDAARRAAEISGRLEDAAETWHVRQTPTVVTNTAGNQVYRLIVQSESDLGGQEGLTYVWDVPFQLGNGEPDFYHPYFIVSQPSPGFSLDSRSTCLRTSAGYIVHISELQAGDQLCVYPNRFDFLFLDTLARRFDMRLEEETGRRPHSLFGLRHSPRPYLLEDLDRMDKIWKWCWPDGMTTTRLHGIRDLLAARFKEWNLAEKERMTEEWQAYEKLIDWVLGKEFSAYTLESPEHIGLRRSMLDGLFFDCLELHLQILKEKGA